MVTLKNIEDHAVRLFDRKEREASHSGSNYGTSCSTATNDHSLQKASRAFQGLLYYEHNVGSAVY